MRFDDITLPRPGATTLRDVLRRAIPRMVQQYLALPLARGESGHSHATLRGVVDSLRTHDSSALVSVFRRPTVACLVAAAVRASSGGASAARDPRALFALDTQLAFELACLGRTEFQVTFRRDGTDWPTLIGISRPVRLDIDAAVESLTFARGHVTAKTQHVEHPVDLAPPFDGTDTTVRVSKSCVAIVPGIVLALVDNNPLTSVQLHPERLGNSLDLAQRSSDVWTTAIAEALARIEHYLPDLASEMRLLLQFIVPVGYDAERHYSCSYPDSVGALYLSLHPNAMTMTEAIIHEYQHNKLHLLERLEPLLRNRAGEAHPSPVRPDPRPLHGVLLAVHAFLPIARLYERMSDAGDPLSLGRDWDRRFREVIAVCNDGARTLFANAQPTPTGADVLAGIRGLDEYYGRYSQAHWPT